MQNLGNKFKIEEMVIFRDKNKKEIHLKDIYKKLNSKKSAIMKDMFKINGGLPYSLNISNEIKVDIIEMSSDTFTLQIEKEFIVLLVEPVKIKLIFPNETIEAEIVSFEQFNEIWKMFETPIFFCETDKLRVPASPFELIPHNHHEIYIYEEKKFEVVESEEEFNNSFNKFNKFVREFDTILNFEKNADYYFNKFQRFKTDKKFIFYRNAPLRQELIKYIELSEVETENKIIFSLSGIGKSFSAIYQLKYCFDLEKVGTLYLHCKFYFKAFKEQDFILIKKILIDEIKFLFKKNFNEYKKARETIQGYLFTNEANYFDLIKKILSSLSPEKNYIIVFDQYCHRYDPKRKVDSIYEEFLTDKKFRFIKIMSMNDEDVKELKMSRLLNKEKKDSSRATKIKELIASDYYQQNGNNDICSIILARIGNNIKNWIEVQTIMSNPTEDNINVILNTYIESKKQEMKKKLMEFFNIDYEDNIYNISKLICFSVDYEYQEKEILKIYKLVPFKYFDIIKENDYYKIKYCYGIIEEIIKELLGEIFKKNSFINVHLMNSNDVQAGNKGYIFEEMVEEFLSPNKTNTINNTFKDLPIFDLIEIPKFIPRENEVNIPFIPSKLILKKTTYLIKQKIFGGKDVDFAILNNSGLKPVLFVFQVSIMKKIIFTKKLISEKMMTLKYYLKNFIENFEIDIDDIYFGYIFSSINKGKKEFDDMLTNCDKYDVSFCFYDFMKVALIDKESKYKVDKISNIVTWPFTIDPKVVKKKWKKTNKAFNLFLSKKPPYFELTDLEVNKILSIVREFIDKKYSRIIYKKSGSYPLFLEKNNICYTSQLESLKSKEPHKYLVFEDNKNKILIFDMNHNNKKINIYSTCFDIYTLE